MNFVILDFDRRDDAALAERLGVRAHPAFVILPPNSAEVRQRVFGPQTERALRTLLDDLIARYPAD